MDRVVTVHPRVCGEQAGLWNRLVDGVSSSPRVRGTVRSFSDGHAVIRFIPACAGNRYTRYDRNWGVAVHPRVCGEQAEELAVAAGDIGSSPRVRGTAHLYSVVRWHARFIPACAGNRIVVRRLDIAISVHPRVCGEQFKYRPKLVAFVGSSPRVRGTDDPLRTFSPLFRFIPACAGNSAKRLA